MLLNKMSVLMGISFKFEGEHAITELTSRNK